MTVLVIIHESLHDSTTPARIKIPYTCIRMSDMDGVCSTQRFVVYVANGALPAVLLVFSN